MFGRVVAVCQWAARHYFDQDVAAEELERLLRPRLNSPREMWLALQQGIITRQELINFVGAHADAFLRHRGGGSSPDPERMVREFDEFSRRLGDALEFERDR